MVAFAFEAYTSSAQDRHGGSLREFAAETGLQAVIRLGALSLLLTGVVLFGVGHDAPRGWSAAWAITISAATLVAVPWVVSRIVSTLDPTNLSLRRSRRLRDTVSVAMRDQLEGQAADVVLDGLGQGFPRSRVYYTPGPHKLDAKKSGRVSDVRLGPLARMIVRRRARGESLVINLHIGLGHAIADGDTLISTSLSPTDKETRRLRRSVRISDRDNTGPEPQLAPQLALLHRQALAAIRARQADDWRAVADLYRLVMLALPIEVNRLGLSFEGAIARPGLLGHGPIQQIGDFLIDELEAAVEVNSTELVDAITYRPQHFADEALKLGAPAIADEMLALYPRMYGLWIRRSR
jgi:hypothetical protein